MVILEEETHKKFGYYPSNLKPKTHKRILVACDKCGKVREIAKQQYRALCHNCAMKDRKGVAINEPFSREHKENISKSHKGIASGKKNPNWHGGPVKRVCIECGTTFFVERTKIKPNRAKYCSRACRGKHMHGARSSNWKGGKVERKCIECSNVFYAKPCEIKRGKAKYCSQSCGNRATRRDMKFPTHHTKPERILIDILQRNDLPFKYVGDSDFWIHNINPDFIECNGKKIAIEVFGDYWHSPLLNRNLKEDRTLTYRKEILKKYGYKIIVFWETDLLRKDAEAFVLNTLKSIIPSILVTKGYRPHDKI